MPPPSGWRVARRPSACRVNTCHTSAGYNTCGSDSRELRVCSYPRCRKGPSILSTYTMDCNCHRRVSAAPDAYFGSGAKCAGVNRHSHRAEVRSVHLWPLLQPSRGRRAEWHVAVSSGVVYSAGHSRLVETCGQ